MVNQSLSKAVFAEPAHEFEPEHRWRDDSIEQSVKSFCQPAAL
jgi:hypothetical protein